MRFLSALLDLYAPSRCAACNEPWPTFPANTPCLCEMCASSLEKAPALPSPLHACFTFEGPLAQAIHRAKYGSSPFISRALSGLLAHCFRELPPAELALPIPLHPSRLRTRGFNQAGELLRKLPIPYHFGVLERERKTPPQVGLDRTQRSTNVEFSMRISSPLVLENRVVLLVDDVLTTGATLLEGQRALLEGGAKEVHCVALAHALLQMPTGKESL